VLDAAIADHRAAIDTFLVRVATEPDPAKIALLVAGLPPVPSLDQITPKPAATQEPSLGETAEAGYGAGAEAPAGGTGEGRLVGVMADRPTPTGG
jgi:hypothetical protein